MDFQDMMDVPTWQRLQDAAAAALHLPVATVDPAGRLLLISGVLPGYAQLIENRSLMPATVRHREMRERTEPHAFQCQSGLHYALAPVFLNGNLFCSLLAGPIRLAAEIESTAIVVAKMTGIHSDDLLEQLKALPVSSNESLAAAQVLVEALARILPDVSLYRRDAARQLATMRTLLEFSNQLGTQLEPEPLFCTTIGFCVKNLGLQDAAIWYQDHKLRFTTDQDRNALCAEVERRLLPQVLNANNMMHIPDARKEFTLHAVRGIEGLPSAIIALPLQVGGVAEGMLVLYAAIGSLFEQDQQVMKGVAQRLSASLERVQSLKNAQQSAVTDALTGLYNKRHFLDTMKAELARARQFGRPTSLLIFDIDNFKSFNDTYGHPAGDTLLRQMGAILRQHGSQIDVPCRYGGEEFVVIMPEGNPEHAALRAEKLRASIEAYPFEYRKCTVSIGVAVSMRSDVSTEALLREADKALYTSKKTGKNKVTVLVIVDANLAPVSYDAPKQSSRPQ